MITVICNTNKKDNKEKRMKLNDLFIFIFNGKAKFLVAGKGIIYLT